MKDSDHPGIIDSSESTPMSPLKPGEEVVEGEVFDIPNNTLGEAVLPGKEIILPKATVKSSTPLLEPETGVKQENT